MSSRSIRNITGHDRIDVGDHLGPRRRQPILDRGHYTFEVITGTVFSTGSVPGSREDSSLLSPRNTDTQRQPPASSG